MHSGAELVSADNIRTPSPVLVHRSRNGNDDRREDERNDFEAEELRLLERSRASLPRLSHVLTPNRPVARWYEHVFKLWRHTVQITVPHADCRDHLGESLEMLFSSGCLVGRMYDKGILYSSLGRPVKSSVPMP